jgi:hypothetical protein
MQPQQAPEKQPAPEWIDKAEAAKRLKISERTALALASEGKIATRRERNPATNQVAVQFDAVSVDRYGYLREHPEEKPAPPPKPPKAEIAPAPANDENAVALFVQALQAVLPAYPATPPAPSGGWLTVMDGAAYCGLPAPVLHALIKAKRLPAWDVGVRRGGRWRVCRRDLDALTPPEAAHGG